MRKDVGNRSANKPRYRCELLGFSPQGDRRLVALIRRLEPHIKLGAVAPDNRTVTSLIMKIDFIKKEFETQNSVYMYGSFIT